MIGNHKILFQKLVNLWVTLIFLTAITFISSGLSILTAKTKQKTVILKKTAYIRGDYVCLQDIISSANSQINDNPCKLDAPKTPIFLDVSDIRDMFYDTLSDAKIIGKGIRIIPVLKVIADKDIQQIIFAKFSNDSHFKASDFQLFLKDELLLPVNSLAEFTLSGNHRVPGNKFVLVRIPSVENNRLKTIRIRATLRKKIAVYIIKSDLIKSGYRIKPSDIITLDSYIENNANIPKAASENILGCQYYTLNPPAILVTKCGTKQNQPA